MAERQRKSWIEIQGQIHESRRVNIENAIITVDTPLEYETIPADFSMQNCQVEGVFSARFVTFSRSLSFRNTIFTDGIDLTGSNIEGQFVNNSVEFHKIAILESLTVTGNSYFNSVLFKITPDFSLTTWGPFTSLSGVILEQGAKFLSAMFHGHLFLDNGTRIDGDSFSLAFATIAGTLSATDISSEEPINLVQSRVGNSVSLSGAAFGASAMLDMSKSRVEGNLKLDKCAFHSTNTCLMLDELVVDGSCTIQSTTFHGGVFARSCSFNSYLSIGALIEDTSKATTQFGDYKVKELVQFDSHFNGPFSITGSRIGNFLHCIHSEFKRTPPIPDKEPGDGEADFSGIDVTGHTYIMNCKFNRGSIFNRSWFRDVFGTNSHYDRHVDCQGARFERAVRFLPDAVLAGGVDFYSSSFGDEANVGGAIIGGALDLEYCQFHHSLLFELKYHGRQSARFIKGARILLAGCTYGTLVLPGRPNSLIEFISTVLDVPAEDGSLEFLEQSLRRWGRREDADVVRYQRSLRRGSRLSLREISRDPSLRARVQGWLRWVWDKLYRSATSYGTVVWRLFIVALVLGTTVLAVRLLPGIPQTWKDALTAICGVLAGVPLTLGLEHVKRRLWPQ
jgi:hypothetical protein